VQSSARLSKRILADALALSGLLRADLASRGGDTVIAVNYHGTPAALAPRLARQLAFFRERFECLDEDGLLRFLRGSLRLRRPGVVITFDDGLRDNAAVAAPLLEELGLVGWFMVPGAFVDAPAASQPAYFQEHIRPSPTVEHPAEVPAAAMTWDGVRALADRGHVVGCHTWSHRPLGPSAPAQVVEEEVTMAREKLEGKIGRRVRTFCWVRGQVGDYSAAAHRAVERAYDLAFMTMSGAIHPGTDPRALHRFNVEASFPLPTVAFQVSRLNEAAFAKRRRAVEEIVRGIRPAPTAS
jgi:peptidoglycan/xylan/chitin deacetylase (PgdA/CDA1 family)